MSSDPWRSALALIKSRFERAAERFPHLHHRAYEVRNGFGNTERQPPDELIESKHRASLVWSTGYAFRYLHRTLVVDPGTPGWEPMTWEGWSETRFPSPRSWNGGGYFYGEGLPDLKAIAAEAWKLVESRPDLVPLPPRLLADLREDHPSAFAFLPYWRHPAFDWAHVVHWIGREKSHPILRVEPRTWFGGIDVPADDLTLAAFRSISANPTLPKPDFDGPPPRIFSDIENIVSASVWALDWLDSRAALSDSRVIVPPHVDTRRPPEPTDSTPPEPLDSPPSVSITLDPDRFLNVDASAEALNMFGRLCTRFAAMIGANPGEPPDLHLVIVRAGYPAHPKLTLAAMNELPIGLLRPDLERKARMSAFPELIPAKPSLRILYLGDKRWLDQYMTMSWDAATTIRAQTPGIAEWVRSAGPDERFFMGNLWTFLIAYVAERFGPPHSIQQHRWATDGRLLPFAPLEDEDYRRWISEEEAKLGRSPTEISKDVTVSFFHFGAFEMSLELAKWFADRVRTKLNPDRLTSASPPENPNSPHASSAGPPPKDKSGRPLKEPTKEAFAAYRIYTELGTSQSAVARKLSIELGKPITQGTVSRWIKDVRRWREADNDWHDSKPRIFSVDPSRLDLGPRENNAQHKPSS